MHVCITWYVGMRLYTYICVYNVYVCYVLCYVQCYVSSANAFLCLGSCRLVIKVGSCEGSGRAVSVSLRVEAFGGEG